MKTCDNSNMPDTDLDLLQSLPCKLSDYEMTVNTAGASLRARGESVHADNICCFLFLFGWLYVTFH